MDIEIRLRYSELSGGKFTAARTVTISDKQALATLFSRTTQKFGNYQLELAQKLTPI